MADDPRVGNFIHTIDRLCRRPARGEGVEDSPHVVRPPLLSRRREKAERRQHTDRHGIPLVHLKGADGWPEILAPDGRAPLQVISPGIPRARPPIQPGDSVPDILRRVVARLDDGQGLRFPRFHLLDRILAKLRASDVDVNAMLREVDKLWGWGVDAAAKVPAPFSLVLSLLPPALHNWRLSGRAPLLSGRYRWLRRALSYGRRRPPGVPALLEALRETDDLLLNAFLDDLAAQYERSLPHIRGASHVFYPLLILSEPGHELFERLATQAAERFVPLVVVHCEGARVPGEEEEPLWTVIQWRRRLVTADDWREVLKEPIVVTAPEVPPDLDRYSVEEDLTWVPPARVAPWWSSWTAIALFWLLIAGAGGAYAGQTAAWHRDSCATGFWRPWAESGRQLVGTECVGVAEPGYVFTPGTSEIEAIQSAIHSENQRAADLHEQDLAAVVGRPELTARPYVTIVYLAALTSGDQDGLAASREGLAGVAIAQRRQNSTKGQSEPLVRILVANGGGRMQHGARIAQLLTRYQDEDAPIVGVVGVDQSRQATVAAIQELGRAGLPMVASTLSADRLVDDSPFYFQVAPQNARQAAVAAAFARTLGKRGARVYYSDDETDYYSDNLRKDVLARLKDAGFDPKGLRFTPIGSAKPGPGDREEDAYAGEPRDAGVSACGYDGLVYFAGRGIPDFPEFVKGVADKCGGSPPTILAGDDITRFVADVKLRAAAGRVPIYYQSFAVAPQRCGERQAHPFYTQLFETFPFECDAGRDRTLDGHAALAYDATETMITAIRRLGKERHAVPVNSFTVWRQLTTLHTQAGAAIEGATGGIDFGSPRQYPRDKPVLILKVVGGERPEEVGGCGTIAGVRSSPWCASIADPFR